MSSRTRKDEELNDVLQREREREREIEIVIETKHITIGARVLMHLM